MSTITSLQPPAWLPQSARSYVRPSQLWQVPTFLIGLAAVIAVAAGAILRHGQEQQAIESELQQLRALVESPHVDAQALRPRLQDLLGQTRLSGQKVGEAHLIMATALLRSADKGTPDEIRPLLKEALVHLQEANVLGVVPENRPRLWYRLGKTLFRTGGDLSQVIAYLQRSLPRGADDPAKGYGMLVQAHLRMPKPDLDAALEANRQQLSFIKDAQERTAAHLLRGELLVRKKQYFEALKILERIEPTAPANLRQQAVYLRAKCCEAEALWNQAAPLWEELLNSPDIVPGGKKRILFAIGQCYHEATPPNEQKAAHAWSQALAEGGMEGQAASLRLAELDLFGATRNFDQAVSHISQALHEVNAPKDYHNDLISLEEVKELITVGMRVAKKGKAFAQAQQLAILYGKLSSPEQADLLLAETAESWANLLSEQAKAEKGQKANDLQQMAVFQWHKAAQGFEQAAQRHKDEKKASMLWRSAVSFQKAGDFKGARDVLQKYVALSLPPQRLAEGWYALAEAQEALGQKIEARKAYLKCIEYPASACVYRARYRLALEKIEQKNYDQAEAILKDNIPINSASVDRDAHEKSLYRLAGLLYERKKYSHAYFYLEKAARDYPTNPDVYHVRDFLGNCYRKFAEQEGEKLNSLGNVLPQQKQDMLQKQQDWREKAAAVYQKLSDDLELKRERQRQAGKQPPLSVAEEGISRKAAFAVADIKLEMNLFAEALRRYENLAARYRGQIEELFACQRIWLCVTALKYQPEELQKAVKVVQNSLQSIKETLPRLPEEKFQGGWSRQEWQNYFRAVEAHLPLYASRAATPTQATAPPMPPESGPQPQPQSAADSSASSPPPVAGDNPAPPPPPPSTNEELPPTIPPVN